MSQSDTFPFRIPVSRGSKPTDPESLFRNLSGRSPQVQHLWAHQADVLRSWHSDHVDTTNLALELPTGTGKTLIGLLIGEFVRRTREERVAYLCPNRQLAYQVGTLANDYSIDARVLVGSQRQYDPNDFNAFNDSSAIAVTTYSAVFNTNPRIDSPNLMILDDAHASENFIASLWNVEVNRNDNRDLYFAILDFFKDAIPSSQYWNLRKDLSSTASSAKSECGKIPSVVVQNREVQFLDFLDSSLEESDLRYSWGMIRDHLDACHIFITWYSISIRPITPPTFDHAPFANSRQRIYMSATLGEGGELERITGVRKIERLSVPEGWDREGTGRRFILFPDRSLPAETATMAAMTLAAEAKRSLILTPNRYTAHLATEGLGRRSPSPTLFSASDVEISLEPFLNQDNAALVLHNRYDGLDLPGEACHFEWIFDLPGTTNAQETFLLNRLGVHSLLRDRIRTRLTQALGRCTRNPTDHAVVVISGAKALDFCIRSENRAGFHPELQAEIRIGLENSEVTQPRDFIEIARAFLEKRTGWEDVDEWIRNERDSCPKLKDESAQTLIDNVGDEIDYATAMWLGHYEKALEKARSCSDRLGGNALAAYRAWWYYLAGSAATLSSARDSLHHLDEVARDLFSRACSASPTATWFREASRLSGMEIEEQPLDDTLLISAAEAVERRIHEVGVVGAEFEKQAQEMTEHLDNSEATPFEQGLERLGLWLGLDAKHPKGQGVPDGVWSFADEIAVGLEAKSNEQPTGPISLSTAREAQGHNRWIESNMELPQSTATSTVIISDRTEVATEALPNAEALFVIDLPTIRQLGRKVVSTIRSLRAEASKINNEQFRGVIAQRLKDEELDPRSILALLQGNALSDFPVGN